MIIGKGLKIVKYHIVKLPQRELIEMPFRCKICNMEYDDEGDAQMCVSWGHGNIEEVDENGKVIS